MTQTNEIPECFGILEKVFPMTAKRLRQTPDECFYHCPVKTKCLQQAMSTKDGIKVEEEIIERGTRSGSMNFFERWSRKKQAHRKRQK
ncbi:MAG: hypothetical protein HOG03_06315 [Desulfobacula sp.]|jgi:hypothetical protein|uniref:hypothetical protein n=1 Tax=Desulfobacula sp. TaxID=2593537 RepID=UPI001D71E8AC|nr:hypothetical protein [Desulfobacula sp.]MBT3484984.1 hypothetical protein [Desulfobacula sp.]MBT3804199.1 hypothetical protein [Desulfobacula sp.]MBT4025055.1 hypothetical protein [Desulfobacula sp.]MBT4198635.1 hypothetical protein [Desulfobacula sp.]